jgi:hypothetical protein
MGGQAGRIGWGSTGAAAQDALLVLDLNADGTRGAGDGGIDQAGEVVVVRGGDAGRAGMEALAKARDASGKHLLRWIRFLNNYASLDFLRSWSRFLLYLFKSKVLVTRHIAAVAGPYPGIVLSLGIAIFSVEKALSEEVICGPDGLPTFADYQRFSPDDFIEVVESLNGIDPLELSFFIHRAYRARMLEAAIFSERTNDESYDLISSLYFILSLYSEQEKFDPKFSSYIEMEIKGAFELDSVARFYGLMPVPRSASQLRVDLACFVRCADPMIRFDQVSRSSSYQACLKEG